MRIVEKVAAIMDRLSLRPDWGVSELARDLGADKSLVHRILKALVQVEWSRQVSGSRRYSLGPGFTALGQSEASLFRLVDLADPVITELAERLDETVYLSGRHLDHNVIVLIREGTKEVRAVSSVGRRTLMHCGAAGKVLLAFAHPQKRDELLLRQSLERYTPHTITDFVQLRHELEQVRGRGWSFENEEYALGVSGVAAPVLRTDGGLEAAICVRAPSSRLTIEEAARIAPQVLGAAKQISIALHLSAAA